MRKAGRYSNFLERQFKSGIFIKYRVKPPSEPKEPTEKSESEHPPSVIEPPHIPTEPSLPSVHPPSESSHRPEHDPEKENEWYRLTMIIRV